MELDILTIILSRVTGSENVAEAKKDGETFIVACNHRTAFGTVHLLIIDVYNKFISCGFGYDSNNTN